MNQNFMLAVNLCRSYLYSLNYETTCILFILCFYHNYTSIKACWRMYSGFGEIPYLSILVTWTLEDIGMSRWEVEGLLEVVHLHSSTVLSHSAGNWKPGCCDLLLGLANKTFLDVTFILRHQKQPLTVHFKLLV